MKRGTFTLVVFLLMFGGVVAAQSQNAGKILFISSSESSSAPVIDLNVYGLNGDGSPLVIDPASLSVTHGGVPISDVTVAGQIDAGTFTIFFIDIPPGVADQLDDIQAAIEGFAAPATMQESVDYVAVYQAGETAAVQLLEPTNFHNGVKNLFLDGLTTHSGPTALLDSLGGLLNAIETIQPAPDLATVIITISDGTDVVSDQFTRAEVVTLAAGKGVPIHTIHLDNVNLFQPEVGQGYLAELSVGSRGNAGTFDDQASLNTIWSRISSLRSRTILRYTVPNPQSGEATALITMNDTPDVKAATTISFDLNVPSVAIILPAESRTLTLPSLDKSISLNLKATVTWLDGEEREITSAQLYVNDLWVTDIKSENLGGFKADVSQFHYGDNFVQILLEDEQGIRVKSPKLILTVNEGEALEVPAELQASSTFSTILRWLGYCLIALIILAVIAFLLMQLGKLKLPAVKNKRVQRKPQKDAAQTTRSASSTTSTQPSSSKYNEPLSAGIQTNSPTAYLEILEAVTRTQQYLTLQAVETRIGRSPAQADVVFENDITVSRLHAAIIYSQGEFRIYDENSTSGTVVNGQPIPEHGAVILDGDEVHFGAVRTIFRIA